MSEVLQTNIFFIITSGAVVVFTIFLCIALYYLIRILRNLRDVTDRVRRGTELMADDAMAVRGFIKEGIIGTIAGTMRRFSQRKRKRSRNGRDQEEEREE